MGIISYINHYEYKLSINWFYFLINYSQAITQQFVNFIKCVQTIILPHADLSWNFSQAENLAITAFEIGPHNRIIV
jgi:hypothetical protein